MNLFSTDSRKVEEKLQKAFVRPLFTFNAKNSKYKIEILVTLMEMHFV